MVTACNVKLENPEVTGLYGEEVPLFLSSQLCILLLDFDLPFPVNQEQHQENHTRHQVAHLCRPNFYAMIDVC